MAKWTHNERDGTTVEDSGASFDERYPRGVWSGGKGPSIDQAFSGPDPSKTEFPLGRALRDKASRMKPK